MTLNTSYETVTVWLFKTHHFGLRHHRCFLLIFFNKNLSVENKTSNGPVTASKSRPIVLERNPNGCSTDCPAMLWTALTFPTLDGEKMPIFAATIHCLEKGLEQSKKIIQMTMISKYLPRFLWWKVYKYHYILETHTCQPSTSKSPVLQVARCWCHWSSVVRRSCFVPWVWTRWSSESIFGMANWPVKQVKKSDQVNKKGQAYPLKMICKSFTK